MKIVTWFTDPNDCDLGDIYTLASRAAEPGNKVVYIDFPPAVHGVAIVVIKDPGKDFTNAQVAVALQEAWHS